MKIVVVDGQGGGIGRRLVEKLRSALPGHTLVAVGTNALATSNMLRAGADAGATGENAVRFNCRGADVVAGPGGIVLDDAMLGEISPAMARSVRESPGRLFLLSMEHSGPERPRGQRMDEAIDELVRRVAAYVQEASSAASTSR